MNTLQIYPSKRNQLGALAGGAVFFAGGIWMLSQSDLTTKETFAGWLGVIFGGGAALLLGIVLIKNLLHRQPLLQLDEDGLIFIDIRGRETFVLWSDIADFGEYRIHGQRFITVIISEPERLLDDASAIQRRMIEMNLRLTGAPYSIYPATLDYPRKKLLPALQEYHRKYR